MKTKINKIHLVLRKRKPQLSPVEQYNYIVYAAENRLKFKGQELLSTREYILQLVNNY